MSAEGQVRGARRPDTLFWVETARVAADSLVLDPGESHHLLRVHRAGVGAPFEATDGAGTLYRCRLVDASESGARGEILERTKGAGELPAAVHLLVGLPEPRAMESVVEHAVPLGAASITFVACARSERGRLGAERLVRLRRLAIAGVKQSRRSLLPAIGSAASLEEALPVTQGSERMVRLAADPSGGRIRAESALGIQSTVIASVGPPGGFDERELALLDREGFSFISLGSNRLSTETAAISLLCDVRKAILDFHLGGI